MVERRSLKPAAAGSSPAEGVRVNSMLRIAQVGQSKKPTVADRHRWIHALAKIVELGEAAFLDEGAEHDTINLEVGRDFLLEDGKYDLVMVHSIFYAETSNGVIRPDPRISEIGVSPHHCLKKWRTRLLRTKARLIVVYEGIAMSLNGHDLGNLSGYERIFLDRNMAIYRKVA